MTAVRKWSNVGRETPGPLMFGLCVPSSLRYSEDDELFMMDSSDATKMTVYLKASEEAKAKSQAVYRILAETWDQQHKASTTCSGRIKDLCSWSDMTFFSIFLKILMWPWYFLMSLFMPPPEVLGGWLTFIFSLGWVFIVASLVGDFAGLFGQCAGMSSSVTGMTLVAAGTSVPDMFASMIAAQKEPFADDAVGNVTGSNGVNVYLGIGLPWLLACTIWASAGAPNPDNLPKWGPWFMSAWSLHKDDEKMPLCKEGNGKKAIEAGTCTLLAPYDNGGFIVGVTWICLLWVCYGVQFCSYE